MKFKNFSFFVIFFSILNGAENNTKDDFKKLFEENFNYDAYGKELVFARNSRVTNYYFTDLRDGLKTLFTSDPKTFLKSLARVAGNEIIRIRDESKKKKTPEEQKIKFTFAELVLAQVNSYTDFFKYLTSPEPSKLLFSTVKQLTLFKTLYLKSNTLKSILAKELHASNLPSIAILNHYLTQNTMSANQCIAFLKNPTEYNLANPLDQSSHEEFHDALTGNPTDPIADHQVADHQPAARGGYLDDVEGGSDTTRSTSPSSVNNDNVEYNPIFNDIREPLALPAPQPILKTPYATFIEEIFPWAIGGIGTAAICYIVYRNGDKLSCLIPK